MYLGLPPTVLQEHSWSLATQAHPVPKPMSLDPNDTSLRGAGGARTKQGCVQRCCRA